MKHQDFDEAVRLRAYEIWRREGCPTGREHEHWARAAQEIETEDDEVAGPLVVEQPWQGGRRAGMAEIERLRRALWEPQPFVS